jgi:S1-C subfamily serine protease
MKRIIIFIVAILIAAGFATAQADSVSSMFKQVKESVVIIKVKQQMPIGSRQMVTAGGLGSGVLISDDGKIITAAHVVQTAFDVEVLFASGETVPARIISSEPAADVALIQVSRVPKGAVVAKLGDSDKVTVGDRVFVVGAPYGLSYTLTVGHISARHKPNTLAGDMTLAEFFQTDAAINQGNSGGPMFNMSGEVIGIVSHILSQSGGFEGLGFAASSETARDLLLVRKSFWGGMEGFVLEGELANIFNLPQKRAILVQRIAPNSPADWVGLVGGTIPAQIGDKQMFVGGDIILGIDGISYAEDNAYVKIRDYMSALKNGSTIRVKILRAGVVRELRHAISK